MPPNVNLEFASDDAPVLRSIRRLDRAQDRMERKFGKVQRAGRSAGTGLSKSFSDTALKIGLVTAAATGLGAALSAADRIGKAAGERLRGVADALKGIVQISNSQADLLSNREVIKNLRTQSGFGEVEATDFFFALTSQGLSKRDVRAAGKLRGIESDPLSVATAVQKLRAQFGENVLGGRFESIVGALGVGAKQSPASLGGLANLALQPLAIGKELGFGPEAVIAATAKATLSAVTPEQGATQLEALFTALLKDDDKRFAGKGLQGSLDIIEGLSGKDRDKLIGGRKEALLGLGLVTSQREQIRQLTADIFSEISATTPGTTDFIARNEAIAATDPTIQSALAAERSTQQRELSEERLGRREVQQQIIIDEVMASMNRRATRAQDAGGNFVGRILSEIEQFIARGVLGVADVLNPSIQTFQSIGTVVANEFPFDRKGKPLDSTLDERINTALAPIFEALQASTKNLDAASANMVEAAVEIRGGSALAPVNEDR